MSVSKIHKNYQTQLPKWEKMQDVLAGQDAVKAKRTLYLPMCNCDDTSKENLERYDAFLKRAVFLEATKETLSTHVGIAFAEDPEFDPDGLDFLSYDANGAGVSIYQIAQQALGKQLVFGKCGVLVDYPDIDTSKVSQAEKEMLALRATTVLYEAQAIVNWRVQKIGAEHKLVLLVLKERALKVDPADEFSEEEIDQYRVLRLDEQGYSVQLYQEDQPTTEKMYPKQATGKTFDKIPFQVIGSQHNTFNVNEIPLEPLANINLAHYRNSAEYENSIFHVGQVQPYMTNLSEEWRDHLEKTGVKIGSGYVMLLPEGGTFGFAQAEPNMIAKEGMDDKLALMRAMGAKLLEPSATNKTATQVDEEAITQHSVLSLCVANLNEAFENILQWVAMFEGKGFNAKFSVKQDFAVGKLSLEYMRFLWDLVVAGKMSDETFHEILYSGKLPELDHEMELLRLEMQQDGTLRQNVVE